VSQLLLIVLLLLGDDSPLVKAAKANGGGKKPMPKKPITNSDVKKSTGKITEKPDVGPASAGQGRAEARPTPDSLAAHEAKKKALAAAQKTVTEKEAGVADLEKELRRIEQSYYEASDPNIRDRDIAPRFDQTKKHLDAARVELANARDALAALLPKPQ